MHCGFPWWHYVPELARTFQAHWRGAYSMEPTTLLPVISLLLLVSVEYGGWSHRDFSADAASSGVPGAVLPGRTRPWRSLVGALGAHALGVFGFGGGGPWGRDREESKTREMMDKEGGS